MSSSTGQSNNYACIGCRAIKTRCTSEPGNPNAPCLRCQRLKLECDYSRKRPGRKARVRSERPTTEVVPAAADMPGSLPFAVQFGAGDTAPDSSSTATAEHLNVTTALGSLHAIDPDSAVLDVADHLDPEIPPDGRHFTRPFNGRPSRGGGGGGHSQGMSMQVIQDPIALDFLSPLEAESLIRLYYQNLNPLIAILDEKLHSFQYLRQSSSILFTSVLTVAAKFFRPGIYRALLTHVQTILNRATAVGSCDLGIIQALVILVHWKTPTDRSAWVKLGIAMRLAYQLGLHVVRKTSLPLDEMQARTIRAAERTWFCLSCFDRAYSEIFNRPPTIRLEELADVEAWANERADLRNVSDYHVASAVATASAQMMWAKLRHSRHTLPTEWRLNFLQDISAQYQRHMEHWFPDARDRRIFSDEEHRFLRWYDVSHLFKLNFEMIDCTSPMEEPNLIKECLTLAHEFAEQTDLMGYDGSLLYLQDTSATHLSGFGMVAYKLFWLLDLSQKRLIKQVLEKIHSCCRRVADGDEDAITAFIARFYQRLLQTINVESRAVSRAASPSGRLDPMTMSMDQSTFSFLPDQDDFLRISSMPIDDSHVLDDEFWTSLFQSVPLYMQTEGGL